MSWPSWPAFKPSTPDGLRDLSQQRVGTADEVASELVMLNPGGQQLDRFPKPQTGRASGVPEAPIVVVGGDEVHNKPDDRLAGDTELVVVIHKFSIDRVGAFAEPARVQLAGLGCGRCRKHPMFSVTTTFPRTRYMMTKPRAAIYVRVSTDRQVTDGHSLDAQQARLTAHAADWGMEVVAIVEDGGQSGGTLARPGLDRIMELARAGELDIMLATKGDRVARSLRDFLNLCSDLRDLGVSLALADESFQAGDPASELTLQVRQACAQYELSLIRQRVRESMEHARQRGVRIGRPPVGYRQVEGKLIPSARYPVVELAHRLRGEGARLVDVAAALNERGIPTGSGRGRWHPGNVARLLKVPLVAA
jgi:site-specific DNA recombinase